jgi:predicted nucleic acid-binding protein
LTIVYLDASAWIKHYFQESGTQWVRALLAQRPLLACATLGYLEVRATLAHRHRSGHINTRQRDRLFDQVQADYHHFIRVRLTDDVEAAAYPLPARHALRGADTVHLASALALRHHRSTQDYDITFVSSDAALNAAAVQEGFEVFDPAFATTFPSM